MVKRHHSTLFKLSLFSWFFHALWTLIAWKVLSLMIRIQKKKFSSKKIAEREKTFQLCCFCLTNLWRTKQSWQCWCPRHALCRCGKCFFFVLFSPNWVKLIQNNGNFILFVYIPLSLRSNWFRPPKNGWKWGTTLETVKICFESNVIARYSKTNVTRRLKTRKKLSWEPLKDK